MDILIGYDIETATHAGQRRLARIAKICEGYGVRVQYSLFECRITEADLAQLRIDLEDEMDQVADHIRIYQFPGNIAESRLTLGHTNGPELDDLWVW